MKTINVTNARKELYKLIDQVQDAHEPVYITGKNHSAVLLAADDWRSIEETMYLTSIPDMRESIIEGLKEDPDECTDKLKW
ncbi:MAG: type II toxin-antitoxin system Phd/YefM family antitoxin [Candidatus Marinimicrobia bacterium]|nr:type II toxin-antitoxin system Phd/YefM family antitoxin [Candidatus Neomarinimicrobiota bacterium]